MGINLVGILWTVAGVLLGIVLVGPLWNMFIGNNFTALKA